MVDIVLVDGVQNSVPNVSEVLFTSPVGGNGTRIKAATAYNATNSNKSFEIAIKTLNPIIPFRILLKLKTYTCPELIGQLIPSGATLSMKSSAALSVELRITGEEA